MPRTAGAMGSILCKGTGDEWHREILQHHKGVWIEPDEGGKDVFVHASALEAAGVRMRNEGDRVSFVLEDDRKGRGKQAGQLKKL